LRTNLSYTKRDHPLKSLLVTSAKPGEGKSTVASNLAIIFAQSGKKVLLIDADLRRPVLYKYFKVSVAPGLSDFLRGTASFPDILQKSGVENLEIIVGGADTSNPAELLGSVQMQQFISKMELQYDLIIIDSSPILAGTDPTILSTVVQEVIVVVSAGETYYSELQYATESLTQIRGRMPVIVLNNFNIHRAYGLLYNYSGFGYYHNSPKQ
jgi:capsular exopolysaccharide synthesis family protein